MRVLIVEDDPDIAEGVENAIVNSYENGILNVECIKIDNVKDAIAVLVESEYKWFDAVVLDMGLPDKPGRGANRMNGHRIFNYIRNTEWQTDMMPIPIIINTAMGIEEVAKMLDKNTRYSNKDSATVARHIKEMVR